MIDKELNIYDSVCTGCSACTEVCNFPDQNNINPIKLITNDFGLNVPRINSDTCTSCMACYKACPTEDKIFNNDITFDKYKSKIGECYFGYSLDEEHRYEAATAGITTEIATYLLEIKEIDGVVSSYQNEANAIVTEIFTDIQKVRKTRGSIYRQVSLLNGLLEKIQNGNHKKLLVIGLPCHIEGVKTLHKTNKYLKKNVEFVTIALFCKQTKTKEFSDFERSLLKAKSNQKIDYRGKGWPGLTRVDGGKSILFNDLRFSVNWGSFAFTPDYCFTCSDPIGIVADISVGDAWLQKYSEDKVGSSLFIANTILGQSIIQKCNEQNILYVQRETKDNVIDSQGRSHVKFKTSYPLLRNSKFGTEKKVKNISPMNYNKLLRWIRANKFFFEFLARNNITKYTSKILLRVFFKIYTMGFNKFIEGK